ncbi:MAG: hypothetical protein FJ102_24645, partial [Deltaproteobacteria bacterium]|nr:hypothetical protein [Deltaproteobacteria bacterium]
MNDRPLDPEALALLLATDGLGPEVPGAAELRGLRAQLREATAGSIDVADDVMLGVALSAAVMGKVDVADEVMLGVQLAEALAPSRVDRAVDVADAVMAQIGARASTMPRWASLGVLGGG